jgi:two-component system chemotaxis response regulator CheY
MGFGKEDKMDILSGKNHRELLDYLPMIRPSLKEWQFLEIHLTPEFGKDFTIDNVKTLVFDLFKRKEGKIYVCNDHEMLMFVRCGANTDPALLSRKIASVLPEGSCEVYVQENVENGFSKLEMLIDFVETNKHAELQSPEEMRLSRRENVVLVADDDMYMRMLVKKGIGEQYTVREVTNGNEVLPAYKKYIPNMVLLDIHMPGKNGTDNLHDLLSFDPQAYVVMLSADSSLLNVEWTIKHGAKGFLTKPFAKEKLLSTIEKCPTISLPRSGAAS